MTPVDILGGPHDGGRFEVRGPPPPAVYAAPQPSDKGWHCGGPVRRALVVQPCFQVPSAWVQARYVYAAGVGRFVYDGTGRYGG